jgi:hypothetical protein
MSRRVRATVVVGIPSWVVTSSNSSDWAWKLILSRLRTILGVVT